jgi:hypothetical protein
MGKSIKLHNQVVLSAACQENLGIAHQNESHEIAHENKSHEIAR